MSVRARHNGIDPVSLRTRRQREPEDIELLFLRGLARRCTGGRIEVWDSECRWLPEKEKRALDREGRVRGKTWRDMPGQGSGQAGIKPVEELQALNWWLWRRGYMDAGYKGGTKEQRAERDALIAVMQSEQMEAAA